MSPKAPNKLAFLHSPVPSSQKGLLNGFPFRCLVNTSLGDIHGYSYNMKCAHECLVYF